MNIIRSILAKKFRISYSQLAEDIIASEILSRKCTITYIDIGANHPIFGSNSFYFYLRGGQGICVEPNKEFSQMHRRVRPKDKFIPSAVSDSMEKEIFFTNSGRSTDAFASLEIDSRNSEEHITKVNNLHINHVLAMSKTPRIDFLSLDTETMDARIVHAIDYSRFQISVICVETNKSDQDRRLIGDKLKKNGFSIYASNPVNTIFANKSLLE